MSAACDVAVPSSPPPSGVAEDEGAEEEQQRYIRQTVETNAPKPKEIPMI